MNLVIDVGNTSIKTGLFEKGALKEKKSFEATANLDSYLRQTIVDNLLVSSVTGNAEAIIRQVTARGKKLSLHTTLPLPIINRYATPQTLGLDRLAAACGAWILFANQPSLVIDIGTCINYEFVNDKGEYMGGSISPGVKMRFEAMHHFTAKLPLAAPALTTLLTGDGTTTCLQSGVMNGILEEIKGIMVRYEIEYPGLRVILCGGDVHFFENHLNPSIFVAPELVLMGLNSILSHNVTS
jgi:type III pantothenate kinase